jgi:predicted dinucleotide-utilizing enzyme
MKKHPNSYKLNEPLHSKLIEEREKLGNQHGEIVIYSGPVRELCRLAPNNVNTMAVGATIASNLGFDGVQGCLIADTLLDDRHIVEIELTGPETTIGENKQLGFHLKTIRTNPAELGAVTGTATLLSFVSSIKRAKGRTTGIHVVLSIPITFTSLYHDLS